MLEPRPSQHPIAIETAANLPESCFEVALIPISNCIWRPIGLGALTVRTTFANTDKSVSSVAPRRQICSARCEAAPERPAKFAQGVKFMQPKATCLDMKTNYVASPIHMDSCFLVRYHITEYFLISLVHAHTAKTHCTHRAAVRRYHHSGAGLTSEDFIAGQPPSSCA